MLAQADLSSHWKHLQLDLNIVGNCHCIRFFPKYFNFYSVPIHLSHPISLKIFENRLPSRIWDGQGIVEMRNAYTILFGKHKVRKHLNDQGRDGTILLKSIINSRIWIRLRSVVHSCERESSSGSIQGRTFLD